MSIVVYHNPNFLKSYLYGLDQKELQDDFNHSLLVAYVYTNDLDEAFRLINQREKLKENKFIVWGFCGSNVRSTSVGDFLKNSKTGCVFVVAPIGFVEVYPFKGDTHEKV